MKTTVRRRAGRLACATLVTLAVGMTGALAGCSVDRLGAAAVVDGEVISTEEVQQQARDYLEVVPDTDPGQVQLAVLQQMIVNRVFRKISRDSGVRVSRARVSRELNGLIESVGGRKALVRAISGQTRQVVAPSQLEDWMRSRLLFAKFAADLGGTGGGPPSQQALDQANRQLTRYAARMDIELSPRYGRWDPRGGITPLVSGGLSRPAAELAGKPS